MLYFLKFVIEFIFLGGIIIFILTLCKTTSKKPKAPAPAPTSSHASIISDTELKKNLKKQKKEDRLPSTPPPPPDVPPAIAESAPSAVAAFNRANKQFNETKPNSEKSKKDESKKSTKDVSTSSIKRDASPEMSEEHDLNPLVSSKEEKQGGTINTNDNS